MKNSEKILLGFSCLVIGGGLFLCAADGEGNLNGEFKTNATPGLHSNYPQSGEYMSEAMRRNNEYESEYPMENELYTTFKYTELKGFDYNGGDGTVSRRDPSKVLFENGK